MKKLLAATAAIALVAGAAGAEDIKLGVIRRLHRPDRIAHAGTWPPAPNWR